MSTTTTLIATNQSATSTGVTTTANPATIAVGGAAPVTRGLLRFDVSGLNPADTIVEATLSVKLSAKGAGAATDMLAYAADFNRDGSALNNADYDITYANNRTGFCVPLGEIIDAATSTVATRYEIKIPSQYIKHYLGGTETCDIILAPNGATAGATDTLTVHGPAAGVGDQPTLTIVTMTDVELEDGDNQYRFMGEQSEKDLSFAQEATRGVAVKTQHYLEIIDTNLDSYAENISSRAIRKNRATPAKAAVGRTGAGGNFTIELTPEKWTALLPGFLKRISTTGSGPYTHLFKLAQSNEVKTFTFAQTAGVTKSVFPGGMISSFSISATLDDSVTASANVMCRDEWVYLPDAFGNADAHIVSSTAGYDTLANGFYSFTGATVEIDGEVRGCKIQNFTIDVSQQVTEVRGLCRKRRVTGHIPGPFQVSASFDMYFDNEVQLRKFLGNADKGAPFAAGRKVLFQEVVLECLAEDDVDTIRITLPKGLYTTVRKNLGGASGPIMLTCSMVAFLNDGGTVTDSTGGKTSIQIEVINSEPATVFNPATEEIVVRPFDDVR